MASTGIEWTDQVWNPVRGCSRVSPGCINCYAERFAARFCKPGMPFHGVVNPTPSGGRWVGDVNLIYDKLDEPRNWKTPRRVFVNSMSDLFHERVPDGFIGEVFSVMAVSQQHTFQVLTKRAHRMEQWFGTWPAEEVMSYADDIGVGWPLPNVWLGVSVENQDYASERCFSLIESPAAVKFISAEPLIEDIDLTWVEDPIAGGGYNILEQIDWVIVGCESGPRSQARPMEESWVRELRWQCRQHDTAFFYKQAKDASGKLISLPTLDGRQWMEYPNER